MVPEQAVVSQVPVRQVKSGQHATVALHPCNLPLQQSQATLQFSQAPSGFTSPISSGSKAPVSGSISTDSKQQQTAPQQAGVDTMGTTGSQAPVQQTLPAGLMSQALSAQAEAVADAPLQPQQDRYILDHRIHPPEGLADRSKQQQSLTTAVAEVQLPQPTAVDSMTPAVAIAVPSRVVASISSPSLQDWAASGSNEHPAQHAQQGSVPSSPALAGLSPPNARKGMVLLDMTMHTRTVWEFEAVIVLLNGHWPARGLLSGRWPPKPDTPDTVLSTSSLSESPLGDNKALNTVHRYPWHC